ncbi:MAG: hypothetical protein QOF54_2281 [Solirubrobacteraceae bacterium]|jgi:hypothetical protein|nr:hypothetical protein [Solirubrobacteraceae bacterium]
MKQLTTLAGLLALLTMPATASASTRWFSERQPIAEGETVRVPVHGNVTVTLKPAGQQGIKIPCTASGREAFWNTPQGGKDETRSLSFACSSAPCGAAAITPHLPWSSTLEESAIDRWDGVALGVTCGGTNYGTFTGSVQAKVGDVDPEAAASEGGIDDLDNFVKFRGGIQGALVGANGALAWFTGGYRLGGSGWGISDAPTG